MKEGVEEGYKRSGLYSLIISKVKAESLRSMQFFKSGRSDTSSTYASTPYSELDMEALDLILNEEKRYKRKGFGLLFAILMTVGAIWFIPEVGRTLWPSFLALGTHKQLYFWSFNILGIGMILVLNLGMWAIYSVRWTFFERYRIATRAWPWEENPIAWRQTLKRTLRTVVFNVGVITPVLILLEVSFLGISARMDTESFPERTEFVLQLLFCMFMEDFTFYWSHRTLHSKTLYGKIHKMHHEFTQPIGIAAEYAHPLEYLIGNTVPFIMGPTLLDSRMHFFTKLAWLALRLGETLDGHCGYEFSWSPYRLIPFSGNYIFKGLGSAQYHNYHHTHNIGNYSSFFTIWDSVFGTNRSYFKYYTRVEKKIQQKNLAAKPKEFMAALHAKISQAVNKKKAKAE